MHHFVCKFRRCGGLWARFERNGVILFDIMQTLCAVGQNRQEKEIVRAKSLPIVQALQYVLGRDGHPHHLRAL